MTLNKQALIAMPLIKSDEEAWFYLSEKYGCIFDSIRWTAIFSPALNRIGIYDASNSLRGGFFYYKEKRFGLNIFRNPPYTPYVGPFFDYRAINSAARISEQRVVVEAMVDYLKLQNASIVALSMAPSITDCLPFYLQQWKVVPQYTYRIDLSQSEEAILAAMSTERRKNIRKAKIDGISVVEDLKTDTLRSLMIETYTRQNFKIPLKITDQVLKTFSPGNNCICMIAKQPDGKPIAGVYIIHDNQSAFYLIGGYSTGGHHAAGALAMWHAILKTKDLGLKVFDFEGSIIPSIERYFRGFGGTFTPTFTVNKASIPIEIALKLNPKYRNRF